ncbi:MAG TPA: GreA/GreB family elongation factor [Noviherbaspirillum sp.]|uniref:GreA/GreB family elongation factor n=1 Tax=Noviherbaspirillum sp. TaxID=1926288 RepID=UPI002B459F8F|nr:GreA/GreB family elongation factor [Noviherbaspirillum sp.]HJV84623.1 GreA/GreB family elongation factor [Noviherbaspirillum sp.]
MKNQRYLSQEDAAILSTLAEHLLSNKDSNMDLADDLVDLVSSSIPLPENASGNDCVGLYSDVTYRIAGTGERRAVRIVCPQESNGLSAHISILAPLAMSLIGRPVGGTVEVALPFGRSERIEILTVDQASGQADEPARGRRRGTDMPARDTSNAPGARE